MAHVAKVKASGVAPMVGHYAREAEARGYERDNIDGSRTHLNYEIAGSGSEPLAARVRDRVRDAMAAHERAAGKAVRKDANVMFDWVVTLPKDCPPDRAGEFFGATVEFIRDRYGAENVPGGFVHMDEATPHVHVPVVPVRDGKLQASKVVNRADLKTFHKALGAAVDAALGFHVSIELDESQKGAKQLSALSQDEYKAAKDELAAAKAQAARESEVARAAEAARLDAIAARDAARRASEEAEAERDRVRAEVAEAERRLESVQASELAEEAEGRALERAAGLLEEKVRSLVTAIVSAGARVMDFFGMETGERARAYWRNAQRLAGEARRARAGAGEAEVRERPVEVEERPRAVERPSATMSARDLFAQVEATASRAAGSRGAGRGRGWQR